MEGMKNFMNGIFKSAETKNPDGNIVSDMTSHELNEANTNLAQAQVDEAMKEREKMAEKAIAEQERQEREDAGKTPEQIAEELKSAGLDIKFKGRE